MIAEYVKKRDLGIYLLALGVVGMILIDKKYLAIPAPGFFSGLFALAYAFGLIYSAVFYLKAKRRSSGLLLLLFILNVLALVIYACLDDHSDKPITKTFACPVCRDPNTDNEAICHFCKASIDLTGLKK